MQRQSPGARDVAGGFRPRTRRPARALVGAVGLALSPVVAAGMSPLPGLDIAPRSGIQIEITPFFEEAPLFGFDAFRVRVRNPTDRTRSWTLMSIVRSSASSRRRGYETRSIRSSHRLTVDPETERVFEIVVPVGNAARYQNVSIVLNGYGVNGGTVTHASKSVHSSGSHFPTLAMSRELAVSAWGPFENEVIRSHGRPGLAGTRFDADSLPADWRAYAGFTDLWMLAKEWRNLEPRSRSAIADWIAQGGHLYIVPRDDPDAALGALDPPGRSDDGARWVHGVGWTKIGRMAGGDLDTAWAAGEHVSASPTMPGLLASDYDSWALLTGIGDAAMRIGLILLFLIVFAVLIGPVNLFVFCRGTRRQRLFWTTPLISVSASLLLSLVVVFQEGTGGRGLRVTTALLLPDENRMIVGQEQITRTGALLATGFDTGEPALIEPIGLGGVRGARTGSDMEVSGTRYGGRWFVSRSVQAHYVQAARPSRGRIEMRPALIGGDPPEITSTIDAPIEKIFVVDAGGNTWTADRIEPGVARRLRPASRGEQESWIAAFSEKTGPRLAGWVETVANRPGSFFAWAAQSGTDGNGVSVPTLRSIRWEEDHLLFTGPIVEVRG